MDRCLSEVIAELSDRGVEVRPHQVHHAISAGRIQRPRLTGALNYLFTPRQVDALEHYFSNPVKQGRPKKVAAT